MMTALQTGSRVKGTFGSRKEVLPDEFAAGIGVFDFEGVGEVDLSKTGSQVFFVKEAGAFDLAFQIGDDGFGQGGDAVLFALPVADGNCPVVEIDILDAQADAIHQTQAAAVEQLSHEFVDALKLGDDAQDFIAGQDGGKTFGAFGAGEEDGFDVFMEHFAVEEEDSRESLVLGGGGDVPFGGEVGEEGLNFGCAHLCRVAFLVKEDVAPDPIQVGFFGAVGVVFEADGFAQLFEEFFCHGELTFGARTV